MPEWHDIVFRFGAATLIGALMGVYLELRGKPTGLRMLGLVALASAVAVLAVAQHSEADISRVIQGVIAGVGFLGAGVILHLGRDVGAVHGLSTAASVNGRDNLVYRIPGRVVWSCRVAPPGCRARLYRQFF
jgi:putative Mg2+ transporter-C (MgtC) family protein